MKQRFAFKCQRFTPGWPLLVSIAIFGMGFLATLLYHSLSFFNYNLPALHPLINLIFMTGMDWGIGNVLVIMSGVIFVENICRRKNNMETLGLTPYGSIYGGGYIFNQCVNLLFGFMGLFMLYDGFFIILSYFQS